ncbi:hypothetical protein NEISICOT_03628 [Neisseria sicca ATCC 29256]|uniref:Uncharacterized protein n=1 Tax=Neisseria sicca ATCC 29256 TaxID=547045 RepID=C6MAN6_NEISI|nr:hypothetical protein NEISICOT_03628 [Neisseria sicca ATCC 29256]
MDRLGQSDVWIATHFPASLLFADLITALSSCQIAGQAKS